MQSDELNTNPVTKDVPAEVNCNVMLQAGIKRILNMKQFKNFESSLANEKLKLSSDWKAIEHKIVNKTYTNVDEFFADVTRMKENSFNDSMCKNKKTLLKKLEGFVECCGTDVKLIKSCAECYSNEVTDQTDNWFTEKACSKPHLVVLVKEMPSSTDFPAKVMSFDENNVFVRFFGDLTVINAPYNNLTLYSKATQPSPSYGKQPHSVVTAFKAANIYIDNIIVKFGCYNYGEPKPSVLTEQYIALHVANLTKLTHIAAISDSTSPARNDDCGMAKRIKLENEQPVHMANYDETDTMSVEGNLGDDCVNVDDDNTSSTHVRSTHTSHVTTSVQFHVQRRLSMMSTAQSPPRLRDCTSRCDMRNEDDMIDFLKKKIVSLKDGMDQMQREHALEVATVKSTYNEMIDKLRTKHEAEQLMTKKKHWCSNCWKEAKLYCCWETSYCDNLCQRKHWSVHSATCWNQEATSWKQD